MLYYIHMKEYLSSFSAAMMWSIPNIDVILSGHALEHESLHFTVLKHDARFYIKGKRAHSCEFALPPGAITTRNGKSVSSPELLFLELAGELSIHRLILLGLQLCSHPPGHPSTAITTKRKLRIFLEKTAGRGGHRKATRALKYIENGSASIMESITYMILTLPHALGGYALKGAVLNYEIELKRDAVSRLGQNYCYADLYYKAMKLAVEYDSFTYHNSPSEQGKDAMRSAVLERQSIDVMHLTTIQLYDKEACRDFAYNLASRLGKRLQICTKKFDEMHALLRELLPGVNQIWEI